MRMGTMLSGHIKDIVPKLVVIGYSDFAAKDGECGEEMKVVYRSLT